MTSNDRECVNPECGTGAAIGRSKSGSPSSPNQSGNYIVIDDAKGSRKCGMHDQV